MGKAREQQAGERVETEESGNVFADDPYGTPIVTDDHRSVPSGGKESVRKGERKTRILAAAYMLFTAFFQLVGITMAGVNIGASLTRLVFVGTVLFFVSKGKQWARIVLTLLMLFSVLMFGKFLMDFFSSGEPLIKFMPIFLTALTSLGFLTWLWGSRDIREFFRESAWRE